MRNKVLAVFAALFFLSNPGLLRAQDDYASRRYMIQQFDFSKRTVTKIPESDKKLKIIIDRDAFNEVDDQWAIALALLASERFEILGFVAANYDNYHGGPGSVQRSYDEILRVLDAALVDPSLTKWEYVDCPEIDWDLTYRFSNKKGKILRCYDINRDKTFQLLFEKLEETYPLND